MQRCKGKRGQNYSHFKFLSETKDVKMISHLLDNGNLSSSTKKHNSTRSRFSQKYTTKEQPYILHLFQNYMQLKKTRTHQTNQKNIAE